MTGSYSFVSLRGKMPIFPAEHIEFTSNLGRTRHIRLNHSYMKKSFWGLFLEVLIGFNYSQPQNPVQLDPKRLTRHLALQVKGTKLHSVKNN